MAQQLLFALLCASAPATRVGFVRIGASYHNNGCLCLVPIGAVASAIKLCLRIGACYCTASAVSKCLLLLSFAKMEALNIDATMEVFLRQAGQNKTAEFLKDVIELHWQAKVGGASASSSQCAFMVLACTRSQSMRACDDLTPAR